MKAKPGETQWRRPIPVRHLQTLRRIAERYDLQPDDMLTGCRRYAASYARHEFWYETLGAERPPSMALMASWFGMDHTTVIHGVRRHREKLER